MVLARARTETLLEDEKDVRGQSAVIRDGPVAVCIVELRAAHSEIDRPATPPDRRVVLLAAFLHAEVAPDLKPGSVSESSRL